MINTHPFTTLYSKEVICNGRALRSYKDSLASGVFQGTYQTDYMTVLWEWGFEGKLASGFCSGFQVARSHCDCGLLVFKMRVGSGKQELEIGLVKRPQSSLLTIILCFSCIDAPWITAKLYSVLKRLPLNVLLVFSLLLWRREFFWRFLLYPFHLCHLKITLYRFLSLSFAFSN